MDRGDSMVPTRPFTSCNSDAAEIAKLPHPGADPMARPISQTVLRWYNGTGVNPRMGNWAVPYVYGRCAFQDIADAIATARDASHRVYLLGWWVDPGTKLSDGTPPLLLRDLLSVIRAQVRGMFWDAPQLARVNNHPIVDFLNGLPNGAAILDHKLPPTRFMGAATGWPGVHHQKLLVVSGASGLIAFTGGMDINNTRVDVSSGGWDPWHDVHVRVTGWAANDLLRLFGERWLDHPDTAALDSARFGLSRQAVMSDFEDRQRRRPTDTPVPTSTEASPGRMAPSHAVGIGRTYADLRKFNTNESYAFALTGEETAWRLIENGIRNARRFIYIEDQYFVSRRLKKALLSKLGEKQFRSLIVLVEGSGAFENSTSLLDNEIPYLRAARNEIRADFSSVDPRQLKWRIFSLKAAADAARQQWCGSYLHSKTMIFDDECAVISTVNANDRGYTFDTEIAACITDNPLGRLAGQRFARDLRVNLWHKHLAIPHARLLDWDAAMQFWQKPPPGAMIDDASALEDSPLLGSKPILRDFSQANRLWSETIDPDADLLPQLAQP